MTGHPWLLLLLTDAWHASVASPPAKPTTSAWSLDGRPSSCDGRVPENPAAGRDAPAMCRPISGDSGTRLGGSRVQGTVSRLLATSARATRAGPRTRRTDGACAQCKAPQWSGLYLSRMASPSSPGLLAVDGRPRAPPWPGPDLRPRASSSAGTRGLPVRKSYVKGGTHPSAAMCRRCDTLQTGVGTLHVRRSCRRRWSPRVSPVDCLWCVRAPGRRRRRPGCRRRTARPSRARRSRSAAVPSPPPRSRPPRRPRADSRRRRC